MQLLEKFKNQFRKRIINPIRKYKLRRLNLLPIQNIIFSENPSDHWRWLEVNGMNVLDLGFARHEEKGKFWVEDISESTPVYFKSNKANKLIGVDSNGKEVDFFKNYFSQTYNDNSVFLKKFIKNRKELSSLITENHINTIKCDIEGGEIHLFKLNLQQYPSIQNIAIEYHSPFLLKELVNVNNTKWHFNVINHSIFSGNRNMGVVTLLKVTN